MPTPPQQCRALLILTSHSELGDTGRKTGYTVSEAADPWRVFTDAGWEVHVATIAGGPAPEDGYDPTDENQAAWMADPHMQRQLHAAPKPEHVNAAIYDVVYLVGGHGAMWDFPDNAELGALVSSIYERGAVVAAVCHGPAALTTLRLVDGSLLAGGKNVTAFSDAEEKAIHLGSTMPFLLQSKLSEVGAKVTVADLWQANVVVDSRLVTGQNPASAAGVARAAIDIAATAG